MNSKNHLFGRMRALDRLQEDAFGEINPNFSPLIMVHGISGIGKTALCEHFLNLIRHQLIGVGEVIIIAYKGVPQSSSTAAFSRRLLESIKPFSPDAPRRTRTDEPTRNSRFASNTPFSKPYSSELYTEDGAAYTDALAVSLLSASEEAELAQGLAHDLTALLQDDNLMSGGSAGPRIVFFFDQFTRYPENIKRWIGGELYQAFESLKQSAVIAGSAYLLTGQLAWEQGELADSWQVHPAAFRQFELLRLAYSDCLMWMSELGYSDRDLVDVVYEETEGVPARIAALLGQEDFLSTVSNSRIRGRPEPLSQFSAKQRRWLHAAAMQVPCSREAMQLLIGKGEAQDALEWLRSDPKLLELVPESDKAAEGLWIRLKPELREIVLHEAKKRKPLCHAGYVDKMNLLNELNKQVPSRRHRDLLSQLSPIQPFSDKLINEVFGR